jgi:hypothetical protein
VQVNTRQQTERDVKKAKRKHGTLEQMCQVLLSIFFFLFISVIYYLAVAVFNF